MSLECGGEKADDKLVETFKFVCEGVLVAVIGLVGVIGNVLSLIVLSKPRLRDAFHNLLFALACFDTIYIVFGGINYTMKAFEQANTRFYTLTFPYLIYPFINIGISGTIFMTVAISIERFLGVCYPLHLPPHTRKARFYIIPVVFLSFCINIPKFLEARVTWHDENSQIQVLMQEMDDVALMRNISWIRDNLTSLSFPLLPLPEIADNVTYLPPQYVPSVRPTELRKNSAYIKFYILYFRLFFMAVLPLLIMVFLNLRIALDIRSAKVQRFGSRKKMKKEVNFCLVLLCIVVTFMCCHSPRTFLDIWEFSHLQSIVECNEKNAQFIPKRWVICLSHVSHFAGVLNSSINFLIYCFIGRNFRKEFFKIFNIRTSLPGPVTQSLIERRSIEVPNKLHAAELREL